MDGKTNAIKVDWLTKSPRVPDKVNNLKRKTTVESCIEHGGK